MNKDHFTIGKLFTKTACISQEILLKYADGHLSKESAHRVEKHLVDCSLCDNALDGILACGTAEFADIVLEVGSRVDQKLESEAKNTKEDPKVIEFRPNINPPMAATPKMGFRKFVPFFGIAASIALIAVVYFFVLGDTSSKIADRHFQLMDSGVSRGRALGSTRGGSHSGPNPESPINAVATPEELQAQAIALFGDEEYQKAVVIFDKSGDIRSALFAGDCYYALGKFDMAVIRYKKVIDADQGGEEQANFKLALTYLKLDEVAQARMILEKISADSDNDYYKAAKETLDEVIGL